MWIILWGLILKLILSNFIRANPVKCAQHHYFNHKRIRKPKFRCIQTQVYMYPNSHIFILLGPRVLESFLFFYWDSLCGGYLYTYVNQEKRYALDAGITVRKIPWRVFIYLNFCENKLNLSIITTKKSYTE